MPKLCAFGCKPTGVPMHRFPSCEKFPERFKQWVIICGGKLASASDYEHYQKTLVCDRHFTDKDHNRNKRLNALAVPSLYLSGTPVFEDMPRSCDVTEITNRPFDELSTSGTACDKVTFSNIAEINKLTGASLHQLFSTGNMFDTTKSIKFAHVLDEHNYTAASRHKQLGAKKALRKSPRYYCAQVNNMHNQIKRLRSEVCRLRKYGKFATRLANAHKLSDSVVFQRVVGRMAKPSQLFINMQMQASKKPKGRRFTTAEKVLSLSLYNKSPKCYTLLHKYFTLPSVKAMKRLLGKIKLCPGINPIIFEKIKKSMAEKDLSDRLCSLAFDEMALTAQVNYNEQKDVFEGFASNNDSKFADHALVFMVKGIKQNFKQPIAYYFTNCLTKGELKKLIKTVIRYAHNSGLIIVNTVCDQSTVNVSAVNELVRDEKAAYLRHGREWRHDCFSVNGRQVIPIFDTPHLFKGIRNNLLTKDLVYTTKNKEKTVKWEYFKQVYDADKSYGELKLLHKITEEHINPEKINKMRVKSATQLFSHSVAVVAEHLTARGDVPEECRQLVDITLLFNNLFDSLNVSSLYVPDGKIYKGAVKKNSCHHELWRESKKVLKNVKLVLKKKIGDKIRLIETIVPSITNLIRTIDGMEAIWQLLSKKYGLDAMLTRNFNQDPVENFFGNIRSYGARNNAPNTISFEGAFKALLLNNYSSPHSKRANCEDDHSECLQNLDFFLRENCSNDTLSNASDIPQNKINFSEELCVDYQPQEDAGQRNYVCGWVVTKSLKNICKSCQQCRQTLLSNSTYNTYTKAKEYCDKKWLCYPNEQVANCFQDIQNITNAFLKKNMPKEYVRKTISMYCDILVQYPFKCSTHMEQLRQYFVKTTINIILYSWCRNINRILSGKITYEGEDDIKKYAATYYNKHKHYKNKK